MDRILVASLKSSSFSAATTREDKLARNLTLGPNKLNEHIKECRAFEKLTAADSKTPTADAVPEDASIEPDFAMLTAEIDAFLATHNTMTPSSRRSRRRMGPMTSESPRSPAMTHHSSPPSSASPPSRRPSPPARRPVASTPSACTVSQVCSTLS